MPNFLKESAMAVILFFDPREGVSLRGILAALDCLGEDPGAIRRHLSWALLLAEELLFATGLTEFDRAGMAACLGRIGSLGPEGVYASPFPTGSRVLVKGALYGPGSGKAQPEAVALLTALSDGWSPPAFVLDDVCEIEGDVRVLKGRSESRDPAGLVLLEANIDDMTGELIAPLPAILMEAGALDAWLTPIIMKKGRPAQMVSALCVEETAPMVRRALFLNSSTLGVRSREVERQALERRFEEVATPWGAVRVKVALIDGLVLRGAPEYGDCEKLARLSGQPVGAVYEAALAAWRGGDR